MPRAALLSRSCHVLSLLSAEETASMAPSTARSLIVRVPDKANPDIVRLLDIFIVRHAGGYACYENHCPHAGGPLNMLPDRYHTRDGDHLLCTRHAARFIPDDGICVHGPCVGKRLFALPIEIGADGDVQTTLSDLQQLCVDGGGAFISRAADSAEARVPQVQRPVVWEPPSVAARRKKRAAASKSTTRGYATRRNLRAFSSGRQDPWAVLGVDCNDDDDEIKTAYRRLALKHHPDVSTDPCSVERFAALVDAYEAIMSGSAEADDRPRAKFMRGRRAVGGVLVVTMDELRRDPNYHVYSVRLALDHEPGAADATPAAADAISVPDTPTTSDALGLETVQTVQASQWDSVGDLRRVLQDQLDLAPGLRYEHTRHLEGGHDLIAHGGLLLGEHLFLADYELADGDVLHFAVNQQARRARHTPQS